jgi:hypothetical protein
VRRGGVDFLRTAFLDYSGSGVAKRPRGVNHVVNNNYSFAFNIADDIHDLADIGFLSAFVNQREPDTHTVREIPRPRNRAEVGRNCDYILKIVLEPLLEIRRENRHSLQIVHGNPEETLNLRRVQVHREDSVCARNGD